MNWLDWIIVGILGVSIVIGYRRGFVQAIAGLVALILGLVAAILFFPFGTALLIDVLPNANLASVVSFLTIVGVVYLLGLGIMLLVDRLFKLAPVLNTIDRMGGAVMGLLQSGVGLIILQALLTRYPIETLKLAVEESVILSLISGLVPIVTRLIAS